ncbi:MAG: tRNA (adenosine(37)-N6)-threonylcarbamoyltransferase complex dimerization subunit type 1 TsaB [Actinobacteria bacterium]|nr:tRNA (adenosine(37)-N6)-threonylcarbamoyltransferase complex dimerization subunit type 1 TsaB [Actinomycetota bacterium]
MLILGIETSTPQASVAIGSEQGVVASALVSRGASYNEFLLPAIRFCLEEAGLGYRNLGGIAVGLGPGLFTGMRVGVATAKALAQTLSLPIAGMSSLDVLAYSVRYAPKTICAALDARRNEVFHAFYRSSPGGLQRMTDYRVERPEQLAIGIASRPEEVLMVGNGALLYRDIFEDLGSVVEVGTMSHQFPDAASVVELALPRMFREDFDSLYELKPLYLRRSAKRIQWERIRGGHALGRERQA